MHTRWRAAAARYFTLHVILTSYSDDWMKETYFLAIFWKTYSSDKKKVAVSVPFRNRSTEIKRPRERALNMHKGMYLKQKLLLHTRAGTPFRFVHDCAARVQIALRKHYSTAVKLLLNFVPVWVFKLVHVSINNTTHKGSSKPLYHPHSSLKGSSRPLQHHS